MYLLLQQFQTLECSFNCPDGQMLRPQNYWLHLYLYYRDPHALAKSTRLASLISLGEI